MKQGFTLLELSIVLVIIGLIIGGITAGADLIRAAELNSVVSEVSKYKVAFNTFKLKYNALPGDMKNAQSYWGIAAAGTACKNTGTNDGRTCNGDGDGNIEADTTNSQEIFRAWQHLASSEIISGKFTGSKNSSGLYSVSAPGNSPENSLKRGGWAIIAASDAASIGGWYGDMFPVKSSKNWLQLGEPPAGQNALFYDPIVNPTEASTIDQKMDDGKPGTGSVTTFNNSANRNCVNNATPSTATYTLSFATTACTLFFGL